MYQFDLKVDKQIDTLFAFFQEFHMELLLTQNLNLYSMNQINFHLNLAHENNILLF